MMQIRHVLSNSTFAVLPIVTYEFIDFCTRNDFKFAANTSYADDIDTVTRSQIAMEKVFVEVPGRNMRLNINKSITKYIAARKAGKKNILSKIILANHVIEKIVGI